MTSVLILTCADGRIFACGQGCYNGTNSHSDCVCGGRNRGGGRAMAARNVRASFKAMAQAWQAKHPEHKIVSIDIMGSVPGTSKIWFN